MSSKNIDPDFRPSSWSITARLTALFTISTSVLLFLVVAILYEEISRHLDEEHEHLLGEIVRVLQVSASAPGRGVTSLVEQIRSIEANQPASYSDPYDVRVIDAEGRVLAESRRMGVVPLSAFTGRFIAAPGQHAQAQHWTSPAGETFLIAAIRAADPNGAKAGAVVQVALNVTRDRILMNELRLTVVVVLTIALLLAGVAGTAVVRYSLRPVSRIASEVAAISAEDLERRLSVRDRPSELRPLVASFNTMLDRLARAFAGLSEYSENLAHELRTPLNNLKGEAEVALMQERSPQEYRDVLASSLEEYDRLSTMADGLLFLARAESQRTKPAWSVVRLDDKARGVCEFYEGVAEEKKATLVVEGSASVKADPVLIRRALSNLVANALAHITEGGQVHIAISPDGERGVSVDVIDDGGGIAAADLPHVFERFYRTSDTRIRGVPGSGLGLAIVRSIMDLHGGSVAIRSTPGQGTTVTLRFPANLNQITSA